jgi:hypothetical protein
MKSTLLSSIAWLGALQSWGAPVWSLETTARWVAIAGVLGTLTVLIYRLGVWRQELEHTRDAVAAEVKAHREESSTNFGRMERRLDAIDHLLAMSAEHRARAARWQIRTERRWNDHLLRSRGHRDHLVELTAP